MGRYVLPKEIRTILDINSGDSVEVYLDKSTLVLRKYEPECALCGQLRDAEQYKGKNICLNCLLELKL